MNDCDNDITSNIIFDSELEIPRPSSDDDNLCAFLLVGIIQSSVKGNLQGNLIRRELPSDVTGSLRSSTLFAKRGGF